MTKQILVLSGSRQTGQLLLGRMDKLRKRLQKEGFQLVAPDAPFLHPEDANMRQWWIRKEDAYEGLDKSVEKLQEIWASGSFVGLLGFSQGARLVHLLLLCHQRDAQAFFPRVRFGIMVAGYDAPIPPELENFIPKTNESTQRTISVPSLHVYGMTDRLITPDQSRAVAVYYQNPQLLEHDGGHHIPMRSTCVREYVDFVLKACSNDEATTNISAVAKNNRNPLLFPDEETAELQKDEVEALQAIFPQEFTLLSKSGSDGILEHPIRYRILVESQDEGWWPPHPIFIQFQYPHNYPQGAIPSMSLHHENNMMEFSPAQADACLNAMREACELERGMPCVLSCIYAARSFFESGALVDTDFQKPDSNDVAASEKQEEIIGTAPSPSSGDRIQLCIEEGLQVAENVLQKATVDADNCMGKKGGLYKLTIGLVGKPSAGKSSFFNVATAFARQRGDGENTLGGATVQTRPFTTIDPNIGYSLAPAQSGSCPEDDYEGDLTIGSTHGRDSEGRRLIPVLLKDVAGLVPGAYQGRGRGNKFLNDLTDADVLIHVLDASGMADEGGNVMGTEEDGSPCSGGSHPLHDLAWIRKELIEWVYTNLMQKWDTICRKGRSKLSDMFTGYGQTPAVTSGVLYEIEHFEQTVNHRDHVLDQLETWDEGDIHRLASAFLGVRFPILLALNKKDLLSSTNRISDIQAALPLHGSSIAIPLSAKSEMLFMRDKITKALGCPCDDNKDIDMELRPPVGVWQCLQSAVGLANPVLVFPVSDLTTLAPLPGLRSAEDPSLPSLGMIACIAAAGGSPPSHWDPQRKVYTSSSKCQFALRDALLMKPCSTVEDVFLVLKRLGAFGGEFVRAEGMANIDQTSKPISKNQVLSRDTRILKIMTSKRAAWQE